ncbi:glycosyltransferase [Thermoflavimicrobium daqui]|uniref:Uncharacterized protein n=1 Tax=Thermoflavimicrobium daqui TaxID=2137476 RepID=A0A364K4C2_9BACL|nr:glycosyltransferase [Thermoflavimicrobium daqui]RAL24196.1 hypothetical protein DL897_10985 [Thermoflavimicrobium daqui]
MKKILFFTGKSFSHINPIIPLIKRLKEEGYDVYCFSTMNNKDVLEMNGAEFMEYPKGFYDFKCNEKLDVMLDEIDRKINNCTEAHQLKELFWFTIKKDIMNHYDFREQDMLSITNIVRKIQPDVVFRDAVDIAGKQIARRLNMKRIGYITCNLYSDLYFAKDPKYYYSHFLRITEVDDLLSEEEYKNFHSIATDIYAEVATKLNTFQIPTYCHFDPNEKHNIIFSTDFLQPAELNENNEYIIVPPQIESFSEELSFNEDPELYHFIQGEEKLIYIATGSFVTEQDNYYLSLIEAFHSTNYKLLISWNKDEKLVKELLKDYYNPDKLFIRKYLPQKAILKYVSLFITSGGMNSILESIYNQVPMLVKPISAEQVMNGLLIEELGLGLTTYKKREHYMTTGEMILQLLFDSKYKQAIKEYAVELYQSKTEERLDLVIEMLDSI